MHKFSRRAEVLFLIVFLYEAVSSAAPKIPDDRQDKVTAALLEGAEEKLASLASKDREAYVFYLENGVPPIDGKGSESSHKYGLKFSYVYAQDVVPKWSEKFIEKSRRLQNEVPWRKVNVSLSLGHQIFAPGDLATYDVIVDDRSYAAWLYLGFAASLKGKDAEHLVELSLGTVGPSALGEQVQNNVHNVFGHREGNGWSHGLKDEPTLQLFYQKRYKVLAREKFDLVSFYGAALGNVQIGAHVGGRVRLGVHLPDNYGGSALSSGGSSGFVSATEVLKSKTSFYGFAGVRGNAVGRNIFLDGNSYQDSQRVKKHPFTFETEIGLGMHSASTGVILSLVTKSPEFYQKTAYNNVASISFVYLP